MGTNLQEVICASVLEVATKILFGERGGRMKTKRKEIVLAGDQLAKISLYMYTAWEEQMKPPVFVVIPFKEWLENLINVTDPKKEEENEIGT